MSAIWGIIANDGTIENETVEAMDNSMADYKLDRIDRIQKDGVYFACGHQYITNEAVTDVSPVYNSDEKVYFAGDCFLYNREDVITHISKQSKFREVFGDNVPEKCGDTYLAYCAFLIMGDSFVTILRGSFSFAIFKVKENKLYLYSDHLSKRYLAYYVCNDFICFGSTYNPIKACPRVDIKIDKRFIVNAYRYMGPMNFYEDGFTVYEGIYHVDNASYVIVDLATGNVCKEVYWNPLSNIKKLYCDSDEEYRKIFLDTYEKLCISHLRARKETGIMLSGGLDSSSVAAYVAPHLAKEGKTLFSYTSVPASGYEKSEYKWQIENETALIEEQCKRHSNIKPRYIANENGNCMSTMELFQKQYGIPVKPSINNVNINNMGLAAAKDECSILLSGANGNATVSYGKIGEYISLSFEKGRFIRAFREMFCFCKKHNLSRKTYFFKWLITVCKDIFMNPVEERYFLSEEDVKRYGLNHVKRDDKKMFGTEYLVSERQKNNFMYIPMQYIQKGFYYTNQGLLHGYLQLDPTLTVEMVELCLSLPNECFVKGGTERRLVRDYMKELIPFAIIDDNKGFGIQAADVAYCVNRDWDDIKDTVYDILSEPLLSEYLDEERIQELIDIIRQNEYNLDKQTVWYATLIGSLGFFLRYNRE